MKKITLLSIALSALFLFSCTKSNEEKLKDAFLAYAEKNLDNPSSIEILSVDSFKTISTKEQILDIEKDTADLNKEKDEFQQHFDRFKDVLRNLPDSHKRRYLSDNNLRSLLLTNVEEAREELENALAGNYFSYSEHIEKMKAMKDTCVVEAAFKIRMDKKVYDYVAYSDTLFTKFDFYLKENAIEKSPLNEFIIEYAVCKAQLIIDIEKYVEKWKRQRLIEQLMEEHLGYEVFDKE